MSTLKIKGYSNIVKGKLKQIHAKATDNELEYAKGKTKELLGQVQKQAGEICAAVRKSATSRRK